MHALLVWKMWGRKAKVEAALGKTRRGPVWDWWSRRSGSGRGPQGGAPATPQTCGNKAEPLRRQERRKGGG